MVWVIAFVFNSRIFKTASFRISALFGFVFGACFVVLLLVTYLTTTAALRDQIHREVSEKLQTIASEADADGITAIVQDINERTAQRGSTNSYYFLSDAQGKKLAGNIDNVEIKSGWQEIVLKEKLSASAANQMDGDHQLWEIGRAHV